MTDDQSSHILSDSLTPNEIRLQETDSSGSKSVRRSGDVRRPIVSSHGSTDELLSTPPENGDGRNAHFLATERQETVISRAPPFPQPVAPRPSSPMELGVALEGQRLGHFQLEKFVGGGGMGAVFRAVDTMLGRTVAVKILSRDQSDEDILRRFKNEAQSAARLDHDNIARVFYVGEDQGWNYIVFEFIEGYNVRELVTQRGPLPLSEAISYTLQVAEALEHASSRDVVHRDIKPSNVLVMPGGRVKLVDMGLARLHQVEPSDNDLTASGVTLGTFDYISPEQARDPRMADVRSDLYSLGCTLYFMLTGRPPFPEGTVLQKLLSHTSDERPDARVFRPELPDEVTVVINKLLAKHPQQRYQQPSELIGELLLLIDQLGLKGASRGGTVWITPTQSRPGIVERLVPILVPLVACIVAVLALDRLWPDSPATLLHRDAPKLQSAEPLPQVAAATVPAADKPNKPAKTVEQPKAVIGSTTAMTPVKPVVSPPAPDKSKGPEVPGPTKVVPKTVPTEGAVNPPTAITELVGSKPAENELGPPVLSSSVDAAPAMTGEVNGATTGTPDSQQVDASQATPPGAAMLEKPRILIVGRSDVPPVDGALVVDSLATACRMAANLPDLEAIELCFNGPWDEQPLEIAVHELTIRAGDGYAPVLRFRPRDRNSAYGGQVIRLVGGDVTWENVHFDLELAAALSGQWSLFHLDRVVSLDLRGCTLTINNADSNGSLLHYDVAFFRIQPPPQLKMMAEDAVIITTPPLISLDRTTARGEATLIRCDKVTPFALKWVQGLFVSSERLVETGGAVMEQEWDGRVEIALENVTAAMRQGMCLMRSSSDAPQQLRLAVDCQNCILTWDPTTSLIEHQGIPSTTSLGSLLEKLNVANCYFPDKNLVWRIIPPDGFAQPRDFDFTLAQRELWFHESLCGKVERLKWRRVPAGAPHEQSMADYTLDGGDVNPAIRSKAGFDPGQLPDVAGLGESAAAESTASPTSPRG